METNKALTSDQLNKLKETVRQRFDELYHRIGTNRQSLATKVLLVDQSIIKEFNKETIDAAHEEEILRKVRDIEKIANNQLPHVHKTMPAPSPTAISAPKVEQVKPVKEANAAKPEKPAKASKPEKKPKPEKKSKPAKASKPTKTATSKTKTKKKKK